MGKERKNQHIISQGVSLLPYSRCHNPLPYHFPFCGIFIWLIYHHGHQCRFSLKNVFIAKNDEKC